MPDLEIIIAGAGILAFLFVAGVFVTVWKIDEHFVTRREFNTAIFDLKKGINRLSETLGAPHAFSERGEVE